jgi:hypothetical protein
VALFGNEIIGVNAIQGQSSVSPFNALQTQVLDQICTSSGGFLCLNLLVADTAAASNGADTHYQTVGLSSKQLSGLNVNVASSNSAIEASSSCTGGQTANGNSTVLDANYSGGNIASLSKSATSSTACPGQSPSQTDASSVLTLGGHGVPIPASGCADGTANTVSGIPTLLPIICNADDQTQLGVPFGVREALTVLGLQSGDNQSLLRAGTAGAESHAVAAAVTTPTVPTTPPSGKQKCTDTDHDCGIGPNGKAEVCVNGADQDGDGDCTAAQVPSGARCSDTDKDCGVGPNGQREVCVNSADPDADADCVSQVTAVAKAKLPFTGENVLLVVLVGLALTGGGLALANRLRATSAKRR